MLFTTTAQAQSTNGFTPLLEKINERISIADQVALSKWDSGKPVLDSQREADVLSRVRTEAPGHGLQADDAQRFFADQIEANKWVQYGLLDSWHRESKAPNTTRPDLAMIRKQLDQLQNELLDALHRAEPLRKASDCPRVAATAVNTYTTAHSLDALHQLALVRGMANICLGAQSPR
jgi:chorismate mutase